MNKSSTSLFRCGRHFLKSALAALLGLTIAGTLCAETPDVVNRSEGVPFKGTLYLIGGGANNSLQRFVDIAGGDRAVIAILPHAGSDAQEYFDATANLFAARKVKNVIPIMPNQKTGLPKNVNAVFFTGGDQNRLLRLLDPVLAAEIHDFLKQGGLVGGTSAGAAAAPLRMIAGGMDDDLIRSESLLLGDGLGYLPGFCVDTHVRQRCRHDRLMAALSQTDNVVGIGLDEDTAVEIKGNRIKVWGEGHARFLRRTATHSSTIDKVGKDKKASVFNMMYSVLSEGEEWPLD